MENKLKVSIKIEEAAMFAAAVLLLSNYNLGLPFWVWPLFFFLPDLSILGYLFNAQAGAFTYNLFHHKAVALLVALAGYFFKIEAVVAAGLLLFAHSAFDRMLGYGLKYDDDFKHTHLGWIGKGKT